MEKIRLCAGGCGNLPKYKGWCGIKWKMGNRVCVTCPELEKKRARSISKYRLEEARLGFNPMQNPEICKKNHSINRNKRASKTLKKLGILGLLHQQTESKELKEKRFKNIRKALGLLAKEGKINHQVESIEKKKIRHKKISKTLRLKYKDGIIKIPLPKRVIYKSKNNGQVKFRSSWEYIVAKFLDSKNMKWEYESFGIKYWNPSKKYMSTTFPDFFLPKYNLVIEVKSSYKRYNKNVLAKINAIRKKGFNTLLWVDEDIYSLMEGNYGFLLKQIEESGGINAQNKI